MKRFLPLFCVALALASSAIAQVPVSSNPALASIDDLPRSAFPALDMTRITAEDALADYKGNPGGVRYAIPQKVFVTPERDGLWESLDADRMVWRYRITAADAKSLNLGFGRYWMPAGGSLSIYASSLKTGIGPFTEADNEIHRQLWTPLILSNDLLIEVIVPHAKRADLQLELRQVGFGYRAFGVAPKACKSGSCNMDVACLGADDPWQENRRAVGAMSSGGSRFCTGSLLNNTRKNRRMLFATATHCEITAANAASLVVVWNFDAPQCRAPGSASSGSNAVVGPTNQFQSGAIFLGQTNNPFVDPPAAFPAGSRSDFTLVELDDPANPAHRLFWAGWNRGAAAAQCSASQLCASIHHPDGDEKRITYSRTPLAAAGIYNATGVHWFVQWDSNPPRLPNIPAGAPNPPPGVTEPGSSGSPLYNAQRQLVGVLSGGASFCTAGVGDLNDEYGMLNHAWNGLPAPNAMNAYLDPINSGALGINGVDLFGDGFGG